MTRTHDIEALLEKLLRAKKSAADIMSKDTISAENAALILTDIRAVIDALISVQSGEASFTSLSPYPADKGNNWRADNVDFDHQIDCYLPYTTASGLKVYKLKEANQPGAEPMYACPRCIDKKAIALLYPVDVQGEHSDLRCLCCGTVFSGIRRQYGFSHVPGAC
ncbi:hypothetical protein [Enterobacter ludwigii]|uniref:hypothetical protein n=1 Tax=Enterobacter TaxID=547 RepID=UPI003BEF3594